ncbi:hypothetical protein ABXT08_07130 [Chryseobacterium sp. NRRL B-14859]|uniref:hypothetical protein n=1 Tax=Chryseobacterium sp. NRRL B-14859 TaxID=1562763 RepID=UPI003398FF9A
MTRNKIEICEQLFSIAKMQYDEGKISRVEYLETLHLIKKKVKEVKLGFNQLDFMCNFLSKPIIEVDLRETVHFVLAMN